MGRCLISRGEGRSEGVFGAASCRTAYYCTRRAVSALLVPEEVAGKKAAAGFEPANDGFANRSLGPLGYAAVNRVGRRLDHAADCGRYREHSDYSIMADRRTVSNPRRRVSCMYRGSTLDSFCRCKIKNFGCGGIVRRGTSYIARRRCDSCYLKQYTGATITCTL